jgi:hypothetical protein
MNFSFFDRCSGGMLRPLRVLATVAVVLVGLIPTASYASWTGVVTVTSVATYSDGHVVATFKYNGSALTSSATGCTGPVFSLGISSDAKQKAMLSLATSALLSGRSVEITTNGNCQGGQEKIEWLSLQ